MTQSTFAEKEEGVRFSFWLEGDEQAEYHIVAFKAEEALFSLTKIEILLKVYGSVLDFVDRLGKKATLSIQAEGFAVPTYLSGVVAQASEFFEAGEVLTRLVLLPHLAKLEKEPRYRVFQELTIPDIVETLLCEHGIDDALWQLEGDFTPRHFCMQYGETDLAFMHRILAEAGIFYYFIHEYKGKQRPVFCNDIQQLLSCPNGSLRHDSHGSHGLYDIAGASEVYCHSLHRSFGMTGYSSAPGRKNLKGQNMGHAAGQGAAVLFPPANGQKSSSNLTGIAHLPLPICGHKVALSCPFDKSLNGMWSLIAVRHEGMGGESGSLSRDLADYFDDNLQKVIPAHTEAAAVGNYGNAFGTTSLLPRLMEVNGGTVYAAEEEPSPYGVSYKNGMAHNVISMAGRVFRREDSKTANIIPRKAVYACAFTALDIRQTYRPPLLARPVIAGPQEARLQRIDKAGRRYKLALRISEENETSDEVRFWAYADTRLGAAVAEIVAAAGGAEGISEEEIAVSIPSFIVEFLSGNPDRPIVPYLYGTTGILRRQSDLPNISFSATSGKKQSAELFDEADFEVQLQNALEDQFLRASGTGGYGGTDSDRDHYIGKTIHPAGAGNLSSYNRQCDKTLSYSQSSASKPDNRVRYKPNAIPLAQIRADLHSNTVHNTAWLSQNMDIVGQALTESSDGSRFLEVSDHQREDINGVYELNCGERYLCRSKSLHYNASEKLILRGPGGKITVDKYSMTLEAPILRLKGRLIVEEDAFDRQENVKNAIRDELPLVVGCDSRDNLAQTAAKAAMSKERLKN